MRLNLPNLSLHYKMCQTCTFKIQIDMAFECKQNTNCFMKCFESNTSWSKTKLTNTRNSKSLILHFIWVCQPSRQHSEYWDVRTCAGPVLHMLLVAILILAESPALCMTRWVVPRYKRKSVCGAPTYKGIHLKSQISKRCWNSNNCIICPTTDIHYNF